MVRRICSTASCRGSGSYRDRSVISSFIAGLIEALEACRLRLRPIVMTSVAFIAGTIPLVLSGGAGAEVRSATGVTVFAGMIGVTLFGLFLTPVFYVGLRKLSGHKLIQHGKASLSHG
jgi:multidrug efflux pump